MREKCDLVARVDGRLIEVEAYVVEDAILTEDEDMLVGHDFTQKFDVSLASKKRDVILNKVSLQRAQIVRRGKRPELLWHSRETR